MLQLELVRGASIRLTTDPKFENSGTAINLYVDYKNIAKVSLGGGDYIDDFDTWMPRISGCSVDPDCIDRLIKKISPQLIRSVV